MTGKHIASWQKTRAKGQARFVLRRGVGYMGTIYLLTNLAIGYFRGRDLLAGLVFNVAVSIALGAACGLLVWRSSESSYQRAIAASRPSPPSPA
jgi:hypothetical protein